VPRLNHLLNRAAGQMDQRAETRMSSVKLMGKDTNPRMIAAR
jgi:hypothetical protein